MGSTDSRAFEVVVLARSFRDARGRSDMVENFPPSVVELYDILMAHPDWHETDSLTQKALLVARVLDEDPALAARYQADVDAGLLGFGAGEDEEMDAAFRDVSRTLNPVSEMAEMAGPDDGLLGGGGTTESWRPDMSMAPPPPIMAGPPPTMAEPPPTMAEPPDTMAEPPPTTAEPPAPEPAPADTIETWLNAELDDKGETLAVGSASTLAVFFGERSADAVAAAPATIAIASEDTTIDVTVELASTDFDVPPVPQTLRVARDGRSLNRALFDITPRHDGPSTLSVLVNVKGNFLQRLEVVFDVGTGSKPDVTSYGRPAGAAAVLEERMATLQFLPAVGGYQVIAKAVTPDPVMVWITPDELAARIKSVRQVLLDTVSDRKVALNMDIPPELGTAALQKLAFEGFRLYQAVFAGPKASEGLKSIGRWLRETLTGDVTTLQVVSTGFPVPWALMYLAERFDAAPLAWENFIGMRHVVEQIPMAEITAMPPAPTIASTPDLSVRVLYNEGIDEAMPSHPIAAQRAYWAERGVTLTEGTKADDLVKSALAAGAADKVIYLYCHAVASADDSDDSHLIMSGDESVTLGQLSVFAPIEDTLSAHPLVFINACESGELTPNFYDGFVPYFLAKGARGVIGTECKTPGLFASEWSKAFFDEFFTGKALGEVVLELRKRFLATHNNPLGLLYGVHCDADTRVDPALA